MSEFQTAQTAHQAANLSRTLAKSAIAGLHETGIAILASAIDSAMDAVRAQNSDVSVGYLMMRKALITIASQHAESEPKSAALAIETLKQIELASAGTSGSATAEQKAGAGTVA